VEENGDAEGVTFAELAGSNQVANWFRSLGIARGDRMLLMLGNQRALWESDYSAARRDFACPRSSSSIGRWTPISM
jgi:acetyl-CoA synthetase